MKTNFEKGKKQSIRGPVSHDHIEGSGYELIDGACFMKLIAGQMLIFSLFRGLKLGYYAGGEGGSTC